MAVVLMKLAYRNFFKQITVCLDCISMCLYQLSLGYVLLIIFKLPPGSANP
jgi:hypothetical protein